VFRRIDGARCLLAKPDCEIDYRREPGTRTIRGRFGVLGKPPRGIRVTVEWTAAEDAPMILFERRIGPGDRDMHAFSVDLPGEGPGSLAIKATRETVDAGELWVWFGDVRFD
jgi:hypothetical protein